jgi:hypothetical protein
MGRYFRKNGLIANFSDDMATISKCLLFSGEYFHSLSGVVTQDLTLQRHASLASPGSEA